MTSKNNTDDIKFVVKKDAKTSAISYMEYDNLKGYTIDKCKNKDIENLINVNKIVIINPSLIEKLIDKKCKRTLEKIIKMLTIIDEEGDDSSGNIALVIDTIDHFRTLIIEKYKEYMDPKEVKLLLKKLDILAAEVKLRQDYLSYDNNNHKKGR